ncbi:MAG: hypothetical protein ACKVZ0_03375 [Gemmatimonadales bacterium]
MKSLPFGALALALTALAGCSTEGTSPDFTPAQARILNRDVALVAADGASQDVELMGGPGGSFGMGLAPGLAAADEQDAPFRCGTHTRDDLTVTRTCTFKDAAGATQNEYNPLTTASVVVHAEIEGTITRPNWTATVDRIRDLTVSGLAGTETQRTWNGTGSGTSTRSRHSEGGEERQYDVTATGTMTNVVVPVPRRPDGWPLSGTIARQVTVKITGGPRDGQTVTRSVTITFNGTQFVPIKVNENTFTFDLKIRRIVRDDN